MQSQAGSQGILAINNGLQISRFYSIALAAQKQSEIALIFYDILPGHYGRGWQSVFRRD